MLSEHVEFFIKINLRNSASRWLLLYEYITMHGPVNVKFASSLFQTHLTPYLILIFVRQQLHTYGPQMYLPYYLEFKKRLLPFKCFSELKIMARLKFEVLFSNLRKYREHYFPRITNIFAQKVVNFTKRKKKP